MTRLHRRIEPPPPAPPPLASRAAPRPSANWPHVICVRVSVQVCMQYTVSVQYTVRVSVQVCMQYTDTIALLIPIKAGFLRVYAIYGV